MLRPTPHTVSHLTQEPRVHNASKVSSSAERVRRPPPRASSHSRYDVACVSARPALSMASPVVVCAPGGDSGGEGGDREGGRVRGGRGVRRPPPRVSSHSLAVISPRPALYIASPVVARAEFGSGEVSDIEGGRVKGGRGLRRPPPRVSLHSLAVVQRRKYNLKATVESSLSCHTFKR